MFGIGGLEFLIIAIAAILVIGPNELPRVLYNLGKFIGQIREFSKSVTDTIESVSREGELDDIIQTSNEAGDMHTQFRIEQQQALEARAKAEKAEKAEKEEKAKKRQKAAPKTEKAVTKKKNVTKGKGAKDAAKKS